VRADPKARCGTPPGWPCRQASGAELLPGMRVGKGRFVVGALLGRGGMATVYRSHDRRLGRDVALKVMLTGSARDEARMARFEHEAGLMARLPSHPGLLRLLHAGRLPELGERPFLATPLVEGPTLAFRLASDLRMPARRSVALGLGLSRALVVVHAAGVVHRDLTARNVMLDHGGEDAEPIVVDFGMAAVLEPVPGASRLTRPDQRPGTVTAMAPEQYMGRPAHPAMDVYALGRLLYEMLTAEDPHATVSQVQLLERHREGVRVAPRLTSRSDAGPPELRALVDACLEPDPARRPTTDGMVAVLLVLERALERGATVLRLSGCSRCGEERTRVLGQPRPIEAVPVRTARGRWWIVGLATTVVGVVLGLQAVGPMLGASEAAASTSVQLHEPTGLVWPTTVVPMALPVRSQPPSLLADPPIIGSPPRLPAAASRKAVASREPMSAPACDEQRERAHAAARRWDWAAVLRATTDRRCWPVAGERMRLRLVAWIEQRRFDACVDEGADVQEPTLVRLVERCRQRLAPAEAGAGAGGPP